MFTKLLNMFSQKPEKVRQPYPTYTPNPYADQYFRNMEKIEVMWSVLQNLKAFNTPQAYELEQACKKNIEEFKMYISAGKYEPPHKARAYVRLAMLYEKQERWEDGINICVEAIRCGAYEDGSNGKMYGRLARLIKKSGKTVSAEVLQLTKGN